MGNIKVSVVVPIYNVDKYLEQCLTSIVNQDFNEYEVIVVNDGSTDNSKEIAERFSNEYSFIKLINKVNGGLGAARNSGMQYINGEYVVFVDSDDYISTTYLNDLYELVSKDNCDIGICTFEKVYDDDSTSDVINLDVDCNKYYSNVETLKLLFTRKIRCYAWDKIYKRDLFFDNNIIYLEGRLYEDILATIKLISKSNKVAFVNKALYKYRIRQGNITSIRSEKSIIDLNYSIDEVNKYIKECKLETVLADELKNFNISYTLGSLDMLGVLTKYKTKEFYNKYKEYFKGAHLNYSLGEVLSNKYIDGWVKRDFILLKMRLLHFKNKNKK